MVDEHADTTARRRPEFGEDGIQVVDPFQVFDDDALDSEVVAPDAFDQFRVVAALDEDPAGPGDASGVVDDSDGPGGRTHQALLGDDRSPQLHRRALQQESGAERKDTNGTVIVLEFHPLAFDSHDGTAESVAVSSMTRSRTASTTGNGAGALRRRIRPTHRRHSDPPRSHPSPVEAIGFPP